MKIVVDTSIVIAIITNESHKPRLISATENAELLAPASLPFELGNAFSAMFKRGRITLEEALNALGLYQKIPIAFVEISLEDSLQLAYSQHIYAYDAYMLQCARQYHATLLTLDERLFEAAKMLNISIIEVTP